MGNGATHDYHQPQKNHNRRWGWNRVKERTAGREQHYQTPYLCGPQDLDRAIALAKDFPSGNLLAIDLHERNINRVRKRGGVAMQGDIIEVLEEWPQRLPIASVVLDFCGGFHTTKILRILEALDRPPFVGAAVWINLERGRDASSNFIRRDLAEWFSLTTTNRGEQVIGLLAFKALGDIHEIAGNQALDDLLAATPPPAFLALLKQRIRAAVHSYRSDSGPFYDSVVFTMNAFWRGGATRADPPPRPERAEVRHRIRAALAVRTMRADR